jgi:cytochrome c2
MRRLLALAFSGVLVLTACGGGSTEGATSSSVATTTTEAATTSTAVSAEQLARAAAIGDIAAGEQLFNTRLEMRDGVSCSSCHVLDGPDTQWGPTLAGISARAGDRIEGMSDVDYLRQSIVDPYSFVVPGEWSFAMPYEYPDLVTEEQIDNLIAFLLTQ